MANGKRSWINILRNVLRSFQQIDLAYLYGSSLLREDFEDIDLALMAHPGLGARARELLQTRALSRLEAALPARALSEPAREFGLFDLHWIEDMGLPLRFRVLQKGRVLLDRNPRRTLRMRTDVLRDYLDFEPLYHRIMDKAFERMAAPGHGSPL